MDIIPLIFKTKISKGLICPFCNNIFVSPVLATGCGHSFCKNCAESETICPHDKKPFEHIISNLSLLEQINQLEIHCRYGCKLVEDGNGFEIDDDGCPEIVRFGERSNHEENCLFSFVPCPQNSKCPQLRKKDLAEHLDMCQKVSCPHSQYGCSFRGMVQELDTHLRECHYEALKDYINRSEERINDLQSSLDSGKQDLALVRSLLSTLTEKCDNSAEATDANINMLQESILTLKKENSYLKDNLNDMTEFVNVLGRQFEAMMFQQNFRCLGTFVGHQGPVWCMVNKGDLLFTCSSDNTIKVWDISSEFVCIKTLDQHTEPVLCLTIVNNCLYSGGKDNCIGEWCISTLSSTHFITNSHPSHYISALMGHDNFLYSGSNGSVKIWKVQELHKGALHEIKDLVTWVRCISVKDNLLYIGVNTVQIRSLKDNIISNSNSNSNNNIMASGLVRPSINQTSNIVTNNSSGNQTKYPLIDELQIPKPDSHVHSMMFLDKYFVCGTSTGDIYIWDYNTRALMNTITGHVDRINSLACIFLAGVWRIFSASNDRTIRVWRLDHMVCTQILTRHQGSVQSVIWVKGRLFSAAVDTSIKVWVAGSQ